MASNTNLGNTPVSQGYTQLFHTGETGGLTSTLQQVFDGDGTGSDLYLATNKVKIGTAGSFLIGSKTIQEYIQDIVGDMFDTNGSHTNVTATYDDAGDGAIDLNATGAIASIIAGTGITTSGSGNITINVDTSSIATRSYVDTEVAGLVDSAPGTLDTLNELASALGDDPNFATTTATSLGNRVRVDTASQGLTSTQKSNARTNIDVDPAGTDNSTPVTLAGSRNYITAGGTDNQTLTLGQIDISDDTNLVGGTGITLTGDTLSTTDSEIVHDNLSGYVENEHKDHSAINITTGSGSGLSGGGNIASSRSLTLNVNNLDAQVPALELADKVAIYDNSATETNVATLTQLKAIVNTDTNTNQLTTFDVSGDSGTDQTISHGNTLTISGGNGITTSTSATDILSVALGGFSSLTSQSSPAEQDLVVIEEAIGGAIKKVQVGALTSSGISFNGSTANGLLTYGNSTTADVETDLTYDGTLQLGSANAQKIIKISGNRSMFGYNANFAIVQGGNTKGIKFNTNTDTFGGSPKMTITTAGDVGIGTESPSQKLDIQDGQLTFTHSSLNQALSGRIRFNEYSNESNVSGAYIQYNGSSNYLQMFTNTETTDYEFLRALRGSHLALQPSSGNVGVNTTSPGYTLDVNGTGRFQDHLRLLDNKLLIMGAGDKFQIGHKATYSQIATYEGHLYIDNNADDQDIIFRTDDGSGGVTTYLSLRGAEGQMRAFKQLRMQDNVMLQVGSSGDGQFFHNTADTFLKSTTGMLQIQNTASNQDIRFSVNDGGSTTNILTLNSASSRVGINTTNPLDRFDVYDAGNLTARFRSGADMAQIRFQNNTQNWYEGINSAEQFFWYSGQVGATTGFINTNGNLYWNYHFLNNNNNYGLIGRDTGSNTRNTIKIDSSNNVIVGDSNLTGNTYTYSASRMYINTDAGQCQIGPQNSSWNHIYTNRPGHLFDKNPTSLDGKFQSYSGVDLNLRRSQGDTDRLLIQSGIATFSQSLHVEKGLSVDPKTHSLNSDARYHINVLSHRDNTSRAGAFIIDTDIARNSNRMSVIHVHGHAYGDHSIIDFKICFYPYSGINGPDGNAGSIINYSMTDNGNDGKPKFVGINSSGNVAIAIDDYDGANKYFWHFQVDWYNGTSAVQTPTWSVSTSTTDGFGWIQKRTLTPPLLTDRIGTTDNHVKLAGTTSSFILPANHYNDKIVMYSGGNEKIGTEANTLLFTADNLKSKTAGGSTTFTLDSSGQARFIGATDIGLVVVSTDSGSGIAIKDSGTSGDYYNGIFCSGNQLFLKANNNERLRIDGNKTYIKGTGANGLVLDNDNSQTNNSGRIFFEGTSTSCIMQEYNDLSFRTGATSGSSSGTERVSINTTGLRVHSGSLGVGVAGSSTDGRGDFSNDVVAFSTSDERLKENVKPLHNALDKISKISGVEFDWKELNKEEKKTIHSNEGHDVGVIAQEIEEVLPEVVTTRKNGYKAVKYEKIVPLLIQAIKEQQQQIEELKNG